MNVVNARPRIALEATLPALRLAATPAVARRVARGLGITVAVLPFVLLLTPWQQNVPGSGRVVALAPVERQQRLEAPVDGRVVRWHVREGSVVHSGTPVVEISDNDPELIPRLELQRSAAQARVEAARGRVDTNAAQVGALEDARRLAIEAASERLRMAAERVAAARQAVVAAEAAARTARTNLDRQRLLLEKGIASRRTFELAELEGERTRTDVDRARASLRASTNEESSLRADRDRTDREAAARVDATRASLQSAEAELASARGELARVEVAVARQRTQTVLAPCAGTIVRIEAGQGGEMVKAGEALALFVPSTDERAAEIWLDGNDASLVWEGRSVRLQFEGWPAVQFVGWPSVAKGTFPGKVAVVDATDDGRGRFRVLVVPDGSEPWPSARYLRQGVRAKAWVLLDRVTLGFELWRQLNGFPPVVSPPSGTSSSSRKGA